MNNNNLLNNLCAKARQENPPSVDIASPVMARLRALEKPADDSVLFHPLEWLTALSSATAVAAGTLIFMNFHEWTDPLIALLFEIQ